MTSFDMMFQILIDRKFYGKFKGYVRWLSPRRHRGNEQKQTAQLYGCRQEH